MCPCAKCTENGNFTTAKELNVSIKTGMQQCAIECNQNSEFVIDATVSLTFTCISIDKWTFAAEVPVTLPPIPEAFNRVQ